MAEPEKSRAKLSRVLIMSGWILMLALAVMIMAGLVYMEVTRQRSEYLQHAGDIMMGFIFGTFVTMVRDFINADQES